MKIQLYLKHNMLQLYPPKNNNVKVEQVQGTTDSNNKIPEIQYSTLLHHNVNS